QPRMAGVHKSKTRKCQTPVQNQTALPLTPFAPQSMSWAITIGRWAYNGSLLFGWPIEKRKWEDEGKDHFKDAPNRGLTLQT
ncbi:hypothetical protein M407DRAFT_243978, partial [Tulasnella calospora MUT 4182]